MASIALFQIQGWEEDYLSHALRNAGHIVDCYPTPLDAAHLPDKKEYDAVSVFVGSGVSAEVIDAFSGLKLITTRSTGFDHIDVAHARAKGIALGYVPYYGENTVAEFAMGLLLTLSRKLYPGIDRIKETSSFSFEGLEGFDLKGKTIGVIGTGRIGAHLIKMAKGFDMQVISYDPKHNDELAAQLGFSYVSLDELLASSDVITLHVPYIPDTHHLINKENISKIKKGAVLINTARGPLVETQALVAALQDGTLSGAGLDVLEEEGVVKDEMGFLMRNESGEHDLRAVLANHILMDMPNVVITPHNAFNTKEAKTRILDADIENITGLLGGSGIKYPIV